tara:strand:+ start:2127 stop:2273 length:147 start_codon:yes stop_codon:yes gene_type:complete
MLYKRKKGGRFTCELCDDEVTIVSRQDGEGAGSIWICIDCNEKYPRKK